MTKYQVSYKNSISTSTDLDCPIIIPNKLWKIGSLQEVLIFLQERDNLDVDSKIIVYAVEGYFLNYNNRPQDISEIKFTERNFLTKLTQEEIQEKLKAEACKHIGQIIELNDQYEIINPKINKNDYAEPENGIITLEKFLYNSEESAFSRLKEKHYNATFNNLKKDNFTPNELIGALCGLSS